MKLIAACLFWWTTLSASLLAGDGRRVALVIGNANYASPGELNNPLRDAAGMAKTLTDLNFEVTHIPDANRDRMLRAITEFGQKIKTADVSLFFFSGHGLQSNGSNFLVPLGATLDSEEEVETEMVNANRVLVKMDAAATAVNIVILDCCRNDPFRRAFRNAGPAGLAALDAPKGTIVAYATAPGTVASDGEKGGFGLYTGCLLTEIKKAGLPIERVFKNVRLGVTGKQPKQVPWESSSLTGEFYFAEQGAGTPTGKTRSLAPLPTGAFEGTVVFTYPDQKKVISKRVIEVAASQSELVLRSSDTYEWDKTKVYASHVILNGGTDGTAFVSKKQTAVRTDYAQWSDEEMRLEFADDGKSAVFTARFRDGEHIVVGAGLFKRRN